MVAEQVLTEWMDRVRAEYREMPGLSLTTRQMRRLWLLDAGLCDTVVDALVACEFLRRRRDETYVLAESH